MKSVLFSMVLGVFASGSALAASGFSLKPAVIYYSNKVSSNSTSGSTYQWIDLAFGYQMDNGLYIGAMYHTPTITEHGTSDCTYQHNGYGPSLGYRGDAFYVIGTYFMENKRSGCGSTYKSGTHYQVDVGYAFSAGSFKVAPQLSYYNYAYTQSDTGASLTPTVTYFGLVPMIALILEF